MELFKQSQMEQSTHGCTEKQPAIILHTKWQEHLLKQQAELVTQVGEATKKAEKAKRKKKKRKSKKTKSD